jgi:acyl-coenzyme A synthetase/AMP-(fatty) acid ligase
MDEDGYLFIVGRKSEIIKSGSYRIGPREIEEALVALADVADAAVVGRPDEIMGEVPVAFVVPRTPGTCSPDVLLEELRRSLPRHKLPREVFLVETLPRTPTGKLRRIELQERLRAQAS